MRFSTFTFFLLSLAAIFALHDGAWFSAGCFIAAGAIVAAVSVAPTMRRRAGEGNAGQSSALREEE